MRRTTRYPLVLAAIMAAGPPAAAQTASQPRLVFSIGGGLTTGQSLWSVPVQPLGVIGTASFDTLSVARRLRPGLTGTLGVTLFRSPRLGYSLEIGYFGLGSEQRCSGPAEYVPDAEGINEQACTRAQGLHVQTSLVAFQAGLTWRLSPESRISPYLRAGIGPALLGSSPFVRTQGTVRSSRCWRQPDSLCTLVILDEADAPEVTWSATLAAGIAFHLGEAYRVRMEVRDLVTALPYATGPGDHVNSQGVAPTAMRVVNVPTVTFGLDVILERRHTRRY